MSPENCSHPRKKDLDRRALAGLKLYQKGQIGEALSHWLHVLEVMPGHQKCRRYVRQAISRYRERTEPTGVGTVDEAHRYLQKAKAFAIAGNIDEARAALNVAELLARDDVLRAEVHAFRQHMAGGDRGQSLDAMGLADLVPRATAGPAARPPERSTVRPASDRGSLRRDADDGLLVLDEAEPAAPPAALSISEERRTLENLVLEGKELFDAGNYREAKEVWTKVLAIDPNHQEAYEFLLYTGVKLKEQEAQGEAREGAITRPVQQIRLERTDVGTPAEPPTPGPSEPELSVGSHSAASTFMLDLDEPEAPISLLDAQPAASPVPAALPPRVTNTTPPPPPPEPALRLDSLSSPSPPTGLDLAAPAPPPTAGPSPGGGLVLDDEPGPAPAAPSPPNFGDLLLDPTRAAAPPGPQNRGGRSLDPSPVGGPAAPPAPPLQPEPASGGMGLKLVEEERREPETPPAPGTPQLESAAESIQAAATPGDTSDESDALPIYRPSTTPDLGENRPRLAFKGLGDDAPRRPSVLDAKPARRIITPTHLGIAAAALVVAGGMYLAFFVASPPPPPVPPVLSVPPGHSSVSTSGQPQGNSGHGNVEQPDSTSTSPEDGGETPTLEVGRGETFNRGLLLFREQKYEKAIETWKTIPEKDPDYVLAQSYIITAEQAISERIHREIQVGRLLRIAKSATKHGDLVRAEDALRRLVEIAPDNEEGQQRLKALLAEKERRRQVRAKVALGRGKLRTGDLHGAIRLFREALELEPGHREALFYLEQAETKLRERGGTTGTGGS